MSKDLLLEGAVAGHMNHIYDNGEMTFGELKQLLQAAADGKLRGTEKTDGQNIYLSFDVKTGRAKAARNKGQIKMGGLDADELDSFFQNHPSQALRYSFVESLQSFEDIIKSLGLDTDTQEAIFGPNTDIFFNTEIMNPGTPDLEDGDPRAAGTTNVIPYDKKTILIHRVGHGRFDKQTGGKMDYDPTENFETLERVLTGKQTDDPSIFSIETNPIVPLPGLKDKTILRNTFEAVNNLTQDIGINDADTINDYVIAQVVPEIEKFLLDDDLNKMVLKRVMRIPGPDGKIPSITSITRGMPDDLKSKLSSWIKDFKYTTYTLDLQRVLHDFSVAMVDGVESSFIQDNQKQISFLQSQVKDTIDKIENSSNEAAKEELKKQIIKLKSVENINTPSEGFVFDYNGVTYKFTGNFAPTNQILGMERFQRFGPIEPQVGGESPLEAKTKPSTVALFPGSFKPPHKGHLLAAQALAEEADIIYIFVSAPQLSGRAMKSGKSISAEQAVQCWQVMLSRSPIKDKAEVMIGPPGVASSMMTAINFIQHPVDPDNIYTAPEGATVILGVGQKGEDASRYGPKVLSKSKEKRPDLTIKTKAVGPFEHSQEYLSLLQDNPTIMQSLNKGKGRSSDAALYHASDMRDFIDLATVDPIGLEFLKDFVARPQDVLAIMGILGLNPADKQKPEEDQVDEPELDGQDLEGIIREAVKSFRKQTAPKAKPSKGKFQRRMRKRLSKAHKVYLDMGRHDLTKHGGGFHKDRPKDVSNAFLAEEVEEMEEAISMAGGGIEGAMTKPVFKREDKQLKEQEKKLRKTLRIGIKKFFENKTKQRQDLIDYVIQEHELRLSLRQMILEQSAEGPNVDSSDSTGINTLKDLLKNTNVLSTLREVYKTLTTEESQKQSFRAHIVKWIQDTLAPVKLNDVRPKEELAEQVGIDVQGIGDETMPGDEDKFIDAADGSEKEKPPEPDEEEEKMKPITGADTTGRNKAERVYPTIEKSIIDYYGELDNPEDQEMFYDYLIANIKLYFDKWDNEMSETPPEEPTNDEYEQAKSPDEPPGLSAS